MEFCNGLIGESYTSPACHHLAHLTGVRFQLARAPGLICVDFNTLSAQLPSPFNLHIPLLKYWDGQPVTYVCRRRVPKGQSPVAPDGVFFSVAFEIVDEDAKRDLEKRGGASSGTKDEGSQGKKEEEHGDGGKGETEEMSDDVD